jgi:hypothetical protein
LGGTKIQITSVEQKTQEEINELKKGENNTNNNTDNTLTPDGDEGAVTEPDQIPPSDDDEETGIESD